MKSKCILNRERGDKSMVPFAMRNGALSNDGRIYVLGSRKIRKGFTVNFKLSRQKAIGASAWTTPMLLHIKTS